MNSPRPGHLLCLAVWAVAVRAGDPPPTASTAPDAISAAKREFDTIKGPRNLPDSQKLELPIAAPPPVNAGGDEMSQLLNAQAEQKKENAMRKHKGQRGANWLVDAMTEKSPGKGRAGDPLRGKAESATDLEGTGNLLAANSDPESAATPTRDPRREETRHPSQNDNPLTTYMAGWMTPHDFELLKEKPAADGLPTIGGPIGDIRSSGLLDSLGASPAPAPGYQATAAPGSEARSNPYLESLGGLTTGLSAATADLANLPPPVSPAAAPAAPAVTLPPETVPPARNEPAINNVLKPNNDSKYFPQL
ncbi:MAG: hypothetical protein JSR48_06060, partial [Verrucomicrobia bacterium]|nr:hypothetical protein [Verrucomicrobiota bacterium]